MINDQFQFLLEPAISISRYLLTIYGIDEFANYHLLDLIEFPGYDYIGQYHI
jgi:hypothetical protein